ncbi:MAG TPA: septal ring lytic transglycosylase RlpA family protein, partial [Rhodothermales bacterium]|nr:septal ring lytic transglycosylase RlpA family protein [Rhodothermales bacterium]
PTLPPQKLSAVLELPPLPAFDTLPITAVDPDLDIVPVHPPTPLPDSLPKPVPAVASYYHASLAGNFTASGERYDPQDLTAAHRTLPFGTRLRITNMRNGKSVVVRINDRGPFVKGRGIDLSRAAAELLGIVRRGIARVTIQELDTSL